MCLQDAGAAGTARLRGLLEIRASWAGGGPPTSRSRHQPSAARGLLAPPHGRTLGPLAAESADKHPCWEPWSVFGTQLPCSHAIGLGDDEQAAHCGPAQRASTGRPFSPSSAASGTEHTVSYPSLWNIQPQTRGLKTMRLLPCSRLGRESRRALAGPPASGGLQGAAACQPDPQVSRRRQLRTRGGGAC